MQTRRFQACWLPLLPAILCFFQTPTDALHAQTFTRLSDLPVPKTTAAAEPYPGGAHKPGNLTDGNPRTEYSSNAKGTATFVEFEFPKATKLAAFRHVDRNDPATVAESELTFLDDANSEVGKQQVVHVNQRAGVTLRVFDAPIVARRVRWQITKLGSTFSTVGGSEVGFLEAAASDPAPSAVTLDLRTPPILERLPTGYARPIQVKVSSPYAQPLETVLKFPGAAPVPIKLSPGTQTVELKVPAKDEETPVSAVLEFAGKPVAARGLVLKPVRKLDIYVLPHSHVDIGYTALQKEVEAKQNENIETGLRLARTTAAYPEGSRFKWNVEVLWPVDNYLRNATPAKRADFVAAVQSGQVGLDGFYCNILTGLSRPEELLRLMSYATRLSREWGVPVESAMISDVPGYTWSTVTAMAHAGVKYFSFAPNYFDRMGATMKEWQNKPFWWKGPDGQSRVLCWCPSRGYALGHLIGDGVALARFIPDYLNELETSGYPYDITHLRWNVHGDNGSPDEKVADVVRDWNRTYAFPRMIIATTAEAFRAFERRYGDRLPEYSGDYTPYWEDGAASSAAETALNRASAERLVQAETLWAMRTPEPFPAAAFNEAWRNVLLYSEHTWGAHNSISQPDIPFVKDQWKVKQAFALEADQQSRALLARALAGNAGAAPEKAAGGGSAESGADLPGSSAGTFTVFNTVSWKRTDLVTVPSEIAGTLESGADLAVRDSRGRLFPAQRLTTGELVFVARNLPPFSAQTFTIQHAAGQASARMSAAGNTLRSSLFTVKIDELTGAISSLYSQALKRELADPKAETGLNDYFYLPGSDLKNLQRAGKPTLKVKEHGPVVVSLLVESEAPGCKRLAREVRLIDGIDRVEMINTVDKLPVRAKEGLHLGYGFNVPEGTVRIDVGLAQVRPEADQIPASCKNWFSAQRWVDVSNKKYGVTWSSLDAPLVQVGGITANLIGSQTDHRVWIQHLSPSQKLYAWIMNNHWHTNYRADQEGPTVFRFAIRAHKEFEPEEAARFGTEYAQPLAVAGGNAAGPRTPRLLVSSDEVTVSAFKPSDDGKGQIVRLFGASGETSKVTLKWAAPAPNKVWLSDTSEEPRTPAGRQVEVPGWGVVTLRVE